MSWFKRVFSAVTPNETATNFIEKNIGIKINTSADLIFAMIKEGQHIARVMDKNSWDKSRTHIYSSPYTLIGEFNLLVAIAEENEDEKLLSAVCEAIILAFNKYRTDFQSCAAGMHVRAPTEHLHNAQRKHNLKGIFG